MKTQIQRYNLKAVLKTFVVFACCSLIPVGAVTGFSLYRERKFMDLLQQRRLDQASKAVAQAVRARLLLIDSHMRFLALSQEKVTGTVSRMFSSPNIVLEEFCTGLCSVVSQKTAGVFFGHVDDRDFPKPEEIELLREGEARLYSRPNEKGPARLFMMVPIYERQSLDRVLLAEIDVSRLWGIGAMNALPPQTDLCVMDDSYHILLNSLPHDEAFLTTASTTRKDITGVKFRSKHDDLERIASILAISVPNSVPKQTWTLLMSQAVMQVTLPLNTSKSTLSIGFLAALLALFLASAICLRRNDPSNGKA